MNKKFSFLIKFPGKIQYIIVMNDNTVERRSYTAMEGDSPLGLSQELDYINSADAEEIDTGIRKTIMDVRLSILAMGLGLAKIKSESLYKDLGFRSMLEYIDDLSAGTKMNRSGIYNWLYIGEAYIKYKDELDRIGFSEIDACDVEIVNYH